MLYLERQFDFTFLRDVTIFAKPLYLLKHSTSLNKLELKHTITQMHAQALSVCLSFAHIHTWDVPIIRIKCQLTKTRVRALLIARFNLWSQKKKKFAVPLILPAERSEDWTLSASFPRTYGTGLMNKSASWDLSAKAGTFCCELRKIRLNVSSLCVVLFCQDVPETATFTC